MAAGLTQAALASRMGTTQAAVARAESGRLSPRIEFVDRWARACGLPLRLTLGEAAKVPDPGTRRALTLTLFGENNWNPYERDLTDVERRTLVATGDGPERFDRKRSRGR